jgi:hypothetical protein
VSIASLLGAIAEKIITKAANNDNQNIDRVMRFKNKSFTFNILYPCDLNKKH